MSNQDVASDNLSNFFPLPLNDMEAFEEFGKYLENPDNMNKAVSVHVLKL